MRRVPRVRLNPLLLRSVYRSRKAKKSLAVISGFKHYTDFFVTLRSEKVRASPLIIERLQRLADVVKFPRDDIFLP
jgi:hypothetical protein